MDMNYSEGCGREGVGRMEWSEAGKWDNCNSIINKYIKKTKQNKNYPLSTGGKVLQLHHGLVDSF